MLITLDKSSKFVESWNMIRRIFSNTIPQIKSFPKHMLLNHIFCSKRSLSSDKLLMIIADQWNDQTFSSSIINVQLISTVVSLFVLSAAVSSCGPFEVNKPCVSKKNKNPRLSGIKIVAVKSRQFFRKQAHYRLLAHALLYFCFYLILLLIEVQIILFCKTFVSDLNNCLW